MNKISLFILLILIFLGLSKSFSPLEQKTQVIVNERVFANYFKGSPLSIILKDAFQAGFLIKTYYLKLKIVHGFKRPETVIVRTSPHYWKYLRDKLGMSIFRRYERTNTENTVPLPPGSIYIGDLSFGSWKYHNSGVKIWKFHKVYRNFPELFGWGKFRPNFTFFQMLKIHQQNEKPYFGENQEFGTEGSITKPTLSHVRDQSDFSRISFKDHFNKLLFFPSNKKKGKSE